MKTVVVTDGEQRAALALVRSLGRGGYRVIVCSASGRSLAGSSRCAVNDCAVPSPLLEPGAHAAAVREIAVTEHAAWLIPTGEASLLALLEAQSSDDVFHLPFPDLATVRRACDKAAVLGQAADVGIAVPMQWTVSSLDAAKSPPEGLQFPVVVKPSRSVVRSGGALLKTGVSYASDFAALLSELQSIQRDAFPVLVQQRIVGPGIGVFLLLWNGEVQAVAGHRRLREKPPSGGVSVLRESLVPPSDLVERSLALLRGLQWTQGVAMIEFKVEQTTGRPYLMEINPRFWGSLQLVIDAGVDFPVLLLAAAGGTAPSTAPVLRAGHRLRWWWGDVDQMLTVLKKGARQAGLPNGSGGRLRAVVNVIASCFSASEEVFRWDDLRPFFRETGLWFRGR